MVYLPMCYLYCKRYVPENVDKDPTLQSLRKELYEPGQDYNKLLLTDQEMPGEDPLPMNEIMKITKGIVDNLDTRSV